jgi:hypothetical protein
MTNTDNFLTWNWQQYAVIFLLMLCYMVLAFRNKLPPMSAFKDFLDSINSAGGHIFILLVLSVWSVRIEMQYIYYVIGLPDMAFDKHSSVIMVGLSAVQAGLAGTFIGALLKTMSGGKANGTPQPDTLQAGFVAAPPPEQK